MDPHKILGVAPSASADEVRRAYLKMAKKYHPDSGGDVWAFQQVQEAYAILTGKAPQPKPNKKQTQKAPPETPQPETRREPRRESPSPGAGTEKSFPFSDANNATTKPGGFRPSPLGRTRKRKRNGAGAQLIGAIGGGVAALALGYYLLNSQALTDWLETRAQAPDVTQTQANSGSVPPGNRDATSKGEPNKPVHNPTVTRTPVTRPNTQPASSPNSGVVLPPKNEPNRESITKGLPFQPTRPVILKKPADPDWVREFGVVSGPATSAGRRSVSATIGELRQWLEEVEREPNEIKRNDLYREIGQKLDRVLSTGLMKLVFPIDKVEESDNGLIKLTLGESETELGSEIRLMAPEYWEDRISKSAAKEIDVSMHRIEVRGNPSYQLLNQNDVHVFFRQNFVFFFERRGPQHSDSWVIFLKNPKGRIFKPSEVRPEKARENIGEVLSVIFRVEDAQTSEEGDIRVMSSKKDYRDKENLAAVICENLTDEFRERGLDEFGDQSAGRTIRVTGQIRQRNESIVYLQIEHPSQIQYVAEAAKE